MNKENLFTKIYLAAEDQVRKMKKGLIESRIKQKFHAIASNKAMEVINLKNDVDSLRDEIQKKGELDVEKIVEKRAEIMKKERTIKAIKEEYLILFNQPLVIEGYDEDN